MTEVLVALTHAAGLALVLSVGLVVKSVKDFTLAGPRAEVMIRAGTAFRIFEETDPDIAEGIPLSEAFESVYEGFPPEYEDHQIDVTATDPVSGRTERGKPDLAS